MSSRRVLFTPGKPPRAVEVPPREKFLSAPKPQFAPPVPVVREPGSGSRRVWSRGLGRLFILAVACVFTAAILTGIAIMEVVQGAALTRFAVREAQEASGRFDLPATRIALTDVQTGLERMDRGFDRLAYLQVLPGIGDQVEAGARATSAAFHTTSVLVDAFSLAEDVFASVDGFSDAFVTGMGDVRPYADLSPEEKERFLWAISSARDDLRSMEVRLRLAQDDLVRLDALAAHPLILDAVVPLKTLLPSLVATVEVLQPIAQIIPEISGLNAEKQFLVLYADNATLRPGGGVLVAFGQLRVRDGDVMGLVAGDVSSLDNLARVSGYSVVAPDPLVQYGEEMSWYVQDAAWSAHVPETARIATALLRQEVAYLGEVPPHTDGVIIVTPTFLESILLLVGSVQVDGDIYTEKDASALTALSTQDPVFLQAFLLGLMEEVLALSPSRWPEVFTLLHGAFLSKQVAFTSAHLETQAVLEANLWSGALSVNPSIDTLLLVDANLSEVREELITKEIDYTFVPHDDGYQATTRVTYRHVGTDTDGDYRDYVQLYVPLGTELVSASGFLAGDSVENPQGLAAPVVITEDQGFSVYSGFIALLPGESHTLTFTYNISPEVVVAISEGDYQLTAFKQMGSGETLLTLNLDFGTTVTTATPGEAPAEYFNTSYVVDAVLTQDQHFRVRLNR